MSISLKGWESPTKGALFVVTGPSGTGKTTLVQHALSQLANISFSVSATTRTPRANEVDGKDVPIPHFGIVLEWDQFDLFSVKIRSSNIEFVIEPYVRFEGLPGEQKTMFFKDPFGNALEFKSFKQDSEIFNK